MSTFDKLRQEDRKKAETEAVARATRYAEKEKEYQRMRAAYSKYDATVRKCLSELGDYWFGRSFLFRNYIIEGEANWSKPRQENTPHCSWCLRLPHNYHDKIGVSPDSRDGIQRFLVSNGTTSYTTTDTSATELRRVLVEGARGWPKFRDYPSE